MSSQSPFPSGPPVAGTPRADATPPASVEAGAARDRPVLDAGALARLAELDPTGENQLLLRVMKTFQSSAARLSAQLDSARRTGDRPAIRIVAHTLKSSSGYIGAQQLVSRCAELESASRAPTPVDLNALLDAMIAELEVTLAAIARRLPGAS